MPSELEEDGRSDSVTKTRQNKTKQRLDYPRVLFERKMILVVLFLKSDFIPRHHYTPLCFRHPWKNKGVGFKDVSPITHIPHTVKDNHEYILTKTLQKYPKIINIKHYKVACLLTQLHDSQAWRLQVTTSCPNDKGLDIEGWVLP